MGAIDVFVKSDLSALRVYSTLENSLIQPTAEFYHNLASSFQDQGLSRPQSPSQTGDDSRWDAADMSVEFIPVDPDTDQKEGSGVRRHLVPPRLHTMDDQVIDVDRDGRLFYKRRQDD